jgi:Type II restriction endonuclease EcoO109I
MPRGATGLPVPGRTLLSRNGLLARLLAIDAQADCRSRVLAMENTFRRKVDGHVASLPASDARFDKFNTSPFVLLIHARNKSYTRVSQLESDILPAKQFSSMETSAGRMVEEVVLPAYGWRCIPSEMHTSNSAIDGRMDGEDLVKLATLKSGPRCLNDEMSENFADTILSHYRTWAAEAGVRKVDFTYGVLYGTKRQSNKKDWHILRNIRDKYEGDLDVSPNGRWDCAFQGEGIDVTVAIRIGLDWWNHLGGDNCFLEVMTALIRACISPGASDPVGHTYEISDMGSIVSQSGVREDYNVSLLQRSQIPWLFLIARHYCDDLTV